jgi:VWFA-related protein
MRTVACVLLACLTFGPGMMADQAQSPTFRAAAAGVLVEVSVQSNSRPVTNLQIADFEVFDRGVPQTVFDMTYGKLPIDVTVALDVSYSVSGTMLDRLRRAVGQLMRDLRPDDRLRLMMFNAGVARIVDYSSDPDVIDAAMRTANAGGGTSLRDAMSLALVSSRAPGRRQLIVVFTDGIDASSTTSAPVLQEVAGRTTATLTMVVPGTAPIIRQQFSDLSIVPTLTKTILSSPQFTRVNAAYVALTTSTGGTVVPFRPNEDLGALFKRVLESFRSTYVLHFIPTGVDPGGFHELRVTVKRPNTTATARRGYFGG